jgi:hypothetical protein
MSAAGSTTANRECTACPTDWAARSLNAAACEHWTGGVAYSQVDTAGGLTCALRADNGYPVCWGQNTPGSDSADHTVTGAPSVALSAIKVGSSGYLACGLRTDNSYPVCWGNFIDTVAQTALSQLSAGRIFACGLRADNGEAVCWGGSSSYGETNAPAGVAFVSISSTNQATCAVRGDNGLVECWGRSDGVPTLVPRNLALTDIVLGQNSACGVRASDGLTECWGSGVSDSEPAETLESLSVGTNNACGNRVSDGRPTCWGNDATGIVSGVPAGVSFASLSLGPVACGIRTDTQRVQCWAGDDAFGGAGGAPHGRAFTQVVSGGELGGCAIREDSGLVECWNNPPGATAAAVPAIELKAADGSVCALGVDQQIRCWDAFWGTHTMPLAGTFSAFSMHSSAAGCAIRVSDGEAECWGSASDGPDGVAFSQVDVGSGYACGIRVLDGEIQCWSWTQAVVPPTGVAFTRIAVQGQFTAGCGIRASDSVVQCWGNNGYGPLVAPSGLVLDEVAASGNYACGIRASNGQVVCWGGGSGASALSNYGGVAPFAGKELHSLFLRSSELCAIENDGQLRCTGTSVINPDE